MTARELYKILLIEINEVKSSVILVEEFNHFINKSIQMYVNRRYNLYEINQQLTDDLRFLHSSISLNGDKLSLNNGPFGYIYNINLPNDYQHLLSCICEFDLSGNSNRCDNFEDNSFSTCYKMTSDNMGNVMSNYYLRPSYKRPYYFFNTETKNIDDINSEDKSLDLSNGLVLGNGSTYESNKDNRQRSKVAYRRYGNTTPVTMELRIGNDKNVLLKNVYINYLKSPQYVELKQKDLDLVSDESQLLEFPDYIAYEIVNIAISLLLAQQDSADKVQMAIGLNQSIAIPGVQNNTNRGQQE